MVVDDGDQMKSRKVVDDEVFDVTSRLRRGYVSVWYGRTKPPTVNFLQHT